MVACITRKSLNDIYQFLEIATAKALEKTVLYVMLDETYTPLKDPDLATLVGSDKWFSYTNIASMPTVRDDIARIFGDKCKVVKASQTEPTITMPNGDKYWGGLMDQKKHGYGRCIYAVPAGREYIGDFFDDKRHGSTVVRYPNGNLFIGDYDKEKWHGYGIMLYSDGDTYEGEYAKGVRSGKGLFILKTGDKYEGFFSNDVFEGQGKYMWSDGAYYEGEFMDGQHHGQGKMVNEDGTISYEGLFQNGEEAEGG